MRRKYIYEKNKFVTNQSKMSLIWREMAKNWRFCRRVFTVLKSNCHSKSQWRNSLLAELLSWLQKEAHTLPLPFPLNFYNKILLNFIMLGSILLELVIIISYLHLFSYVFHWSEFFPDKKLKYPPCFDGRAVLYPSEKNIRWIEKIKLKH